MVLIGNDAPFGPEWMDHSLKGEWADHRECHIGGDFLLICQVKTDCINFVRSGTAATALRSATANSQDVRHWQPATPGR